MALEGFKKWLAERYARICADSCDVYEDLITKVRYTWEELVVMFYDSHVQKTWNFTVPWHEYRPVIDDNPDLGFCPDLKSPSGGNRNVAYLLNAVKAALEDLAYVAKETNLVTDVETPEVHIGQTVPWDYHRSTRQYIIDENGVKNSSIPPQKKTWFDKEGNFHEVEEIGFYQSEEQNYGLNHTPAFQFPDIAMGGIAGGESRSPNTVDIEHSEEGGGYKELVPWSSLPEFLWALEDFLSFLVDSWKEDKNFNLTDLTTFLLNFKHGITSLVFDANGEKSLDLLQSVARGYPEQVALLAENEKLREQIKTLRSKLYSSRSKHFKHHMK